MLIKNLCPGLELYLGLGHGLVPGLNPGLDPGLGPVLGIMAGLDFSSGVVIDETNKKNKCLCKISLLV